MGQTSKILAGIILLVRSDLTPAQAKQAADVTLASLDPLYPPAPGRGRPRVDDTEIRDRILAYVSANHLPSMRKLLTEVSGARARVHSVAKFLVSQRILEVVRSGRHVGLKRRE